MKLKRNKLYNILKTTTLVSLFSCMGAINADALDVRPVNSFNGIETGYKDEDVPIALEVITGGDGIDVGTYLYRHVHKGVDYYAPWTPSAWVGTDFDKNKGKYNNWGFWNMEANNVNHPSLKVGATTYCASGEIKTGGATATNSKDESVGTLPAGTKIAIYGIDSTYGVVIDSTKHSQYLSKGTSPSELVTISKSKVSFSGTEINLMHDGWEDNNMLHNFKKYAKYVNNARPAHYGLSIGQWKNPNTSNVPSAVRGLSGEWRYIGYNRYGDALDNPYFIADTQSANSTHIYGAARRHTPWDKTDGGDTGEFDPASAYVTFTKGMNSAGLDFEYDKMSKYSSMKDDVVDMLYDLGYIKTKNNVKNEFSLRTNADKQGIILKNQRKDTVFYGVPFIEPKTGTRVRDLYASRMQVWDISTNTKIAELTSNGASSKVTTTGKYIPGNTYEVRVRLANNTNNAIIKESVEVQYGMIYGASSITPSMTYKNTTSNKETQRQGNRAGIVAQKGDESNDFVFRFSVSSNQTGSIDLYGFVGQSHVGVDNMDYNNDTIGIRLTKDTNPPPPSTDNCTITNNGKTKICGKGDIRPYNIQIFDEAGKQIYRHIYNQSTPMIKEGLIPGEKYRIVYNAVYYGDSIMEYTWKDAINDNPNTSVNEYVPGSWSAGALKKFKIPFNFLINKYSGGPNQVDNIVSNAEKNFYVYEKEGTPNYGQLISTDITLTDGTLMTYKDSHIVFQYPYLHTAFRAVPNDSRINTNTNNDRMEITINDKFDIETSTVTARPYKTYTGAADTKVDYYVTYDVNLNTPEYVTRDNYSTSVKTTISINGQVYNVKDQLVVGNNAGITHVLEDVTIPGTGNISVMVNVNSDKMSYESGDYTNNAKATTVTSTAVKYPSIARVNNDTVKEPDNTENFSNSYVGGDANNNCTTPRTKNTWTATHRKLTWSSVPVTYKTLASGETVTFNKYKVEYYNENEAVESYYEEFGIKQILFRSKETTDNKRGNNGWVDLLIPAQAQYAEIKAGYGFELKIVTKYNTDATTKRTWSISNNGLSGSSVSHLNGGHNYGMEEVFLELPGTTTSSGGTKKYLSSTGYGNTIKGLNVARVGTGDSVTWTYSIKPSNTLGIGETPKIYIPQGIKDGDYELKIYTTPLQGIGASKKNAYRALCDRKEVTIKVKGAATDDLDSNIIQ